MRVTSTSLAKLAWALGPWLLIAAVFYGDLSAPAAYSVTPLYVVPILLFLWGPRFRLVFWAAGTVTALGMLGEVLRFSERQFAIAAFNRTSGLLVVWVTAAGIAAYRRAGLEHVREQERTIGYLSATRAAETALHRSTKDVEDLKRALDQSAIVATTDVQGTITYVNDKFCEISRYDREELIGKNHRLLNSGLHSTEFFKEMYRAIGKGEVWRGEIRNRAKGGSLYWVDTTVVPFLDDRHHPYQYIAIRYDITERKVTEAQLRKQQSLAQLGKMAAVVAHEVRNPLAGIRGALQVIGRRLPEGSREQAITGEIIARIDTLNDIVQDLLQFARPREPAIVEVALDHVVRETLDLLRADPKLANVDIGVEGAETRVPADPEQLKLVLLNLLLNSAQAMQHNGRILIRVRRMATLVELHVIDEGPGIPDDVRDHLFEPFFTTKHRGTGLGLATARRIIESHNGTLVLESPAGGGTVAVIRLPKAPL